jgi:hypothetical protein
MRTVDGGEISSFSRISGGSGNPQNLFSGCRGCPFSVADRLGGLFHLAICFPPRPIPPDSVTHHGTILGRNVRRTAIVNMYIEKGSQNQRSGLGRSLYQISPCNVNEHHYRPAALSVRAFYSKKEPTRWLRCPDINTELGINEESLRVRSAEPPRVLPTNLLASGP